MAFAQHLTLGGGMQETDFISVSDGGKPFKQGEFSEIETRAPSTLIIPVFVLNCRF